MIAPGDVLEHRYKITEWLGRGNQAEVYQASSLVDNRQVAIKLLHDDTPLATLQRQKEIERRLEHQNVLRLLDIGTSPKAFLVYEYVEGTLLNQLENPDQQLIASALSQTLSGLIYIHEQGLVHGDVKPSNIMITPDGRAKLLDLSFLNEITSNKTTKEIQGTPAYCSPEQLRGERLNPSCDIYSWCLTAIECLTGQSTFAGMDTSEIIQAKLNDEDLIIPSSFNSSNRSRYFRAALSKSSAVRSYEPELLAEWLQIHCDPQRVHHHGEEARLPANAKKQKPGMDERDKPLLTLQQALNTQTGTIMICGDAGIGKTHLIETALSGDSSYVVIDCRTHRNDSTLVKEIRKYNHKNTLLVLENFSYWHMENVAGELNRTNTTIISTSDASVARAFPDAEVIALTPLSYQATRKLLKAYSELNHICADRIAHLGAGNPAVTLSLAEDSSQSQVSVPEDLSLWILDKVNQQSRLYQQLKHLALFGEVIPRALIKDELLNTHGYIRETVLDGISCFEFIMPLFQKTLYESIEVKERELWHKNFLLQLDQSEALQKLCEMLPQSFAPHYENGGDQQKAFELWYLAGRKNRSAAEHQIAARYFSRAIDIVISGTQVDTSLLQKNLSALIDSVGSLYGYSSPEIASTLEILESAPYQKLEGYQELTYRLARFSQGKGDLQKSRLISDVLLQDKSLEADRRLKRMVSLTHAFTETYLGRFSSASKTLEVFKGDQTDISDLEEHDTVFAASVLAAWVQFVSGDLDEGFESIDNLKQNAPVSHAKYMQHSTSISMYRLVGEVSMALELADELVLVTSDGTAPFWHALAMMQKGALLTRLNNNQSSLDLLLEGLKRFKALNALHGVTEWQALAAETLLRIGDYETAQVYLEEAMRHIETTGETMYESQVLMLNAYLQARAYSKWEDAKRLFDKAIATAQQQEAGLFELNAIYLCANTMGTLSDTNDPTPAKYLDGISDLDRQAIRDYWRLT